MINVLLAHYKELIDFNDKMQKSNCKFVESYIGYQKRKNREDWIDDCVEFLKGAIVIQNELLMHMKRGRLNEV